MESWWSIPYDSESMIPRNRSPIFHAYTHTTTCPTHMIIRVKKIEYEIPIKIILIIIK